MLPRTKAAEAAQAAEAAEAAEATEAAKAKEAAACLLPRTKAAEAAKATGATEATEAAACLLPRTKAAEAAKATEAAEATEAAACLLPRTKAAEAAQAAEAAEAAKATEAAEAVACLLSQTKAAEAGGGDGGGERGARAFVPTGKSDRRTSAMNDCEAAAAAGDEEALRRARRLGCGWGQTAAFAIRHGHLGLLHWARGAGCMFHQDTYSAAVERGGPELLDWMRDRVAVRWRDDMAVRVGEYAAYLGRVDLVTWSVERGFRDWRRLAREAAAGGRPEVLVWLQERGHPLWDPADWYYTVCDVAARAGKLETLRYLRDAGAPWTERTCRHAAENGHLDVLRWARAADPPCPWTSMTVYEAIENNQTATLEWAIAHGAPVGPDGQRAMESDGGSARKALRPLLRK